MTTYYISPTGSDSNNGLGQTTPWKTFAYVLPKLAAGDTLYLMDGTYTSGTSGLPLISGKNGTANNPIAFKALNERKAHLQGDGTARPFYIMNSSYCTVEGLWAQWGDFSTAAGSAFIVYQCNNIIIRRCLITNSNRTGGNANNQLFEISGVNVVSHDILVEENEFYYYHRHGCTCDGSSYNVIFRRNYSNSRLYENVNPSAGGCTGTGDVAFSGYPSYNCIWENNIAESVCLGFTNQVSSSGQKNSWFGNVAMKIVNKNLGLADLYNTPGFRIVYRTDITSIPTGDLFRDNVAVNCGIGFGIYNGRSTIVDHCSAINCVTTSFWVYNETGPAGTFSANVTNCLAVSATGNGFIEQGFLDWSFDHCNAWGVSPTYSPMDSHVKNSLQINPQMGTNIVNIPATSPMKGAGLNGTDIGANLIYRYENGVLTGTPLWDTVTRAFPHGAIVPGMNDLAGESAFDVHTRLGITGGILPCPPLISRIELTI